MITAIVGDTTLWHGQNGSPSVSSRLGFVPESGAFSEFKSLDMRERAALPQLLLRAFR